MVETEVTEVVGVEFVEVDEVEVDTDTYVEVMVVVELLLIMLDLVLTDEMVISVKVEMVEPEVDDIVTLDDEDTVETLTLEQEVTDTMEALQDLEVMVDFQCVVAEVMVEADEEL